MSFTVNKNGIVLRTHHIPQVRDLSVYTKNTKMRKWMKLYQNKTTSNTDYHTIGFESLTYDIKKHKYTAKEEKKFSGAILVTNSGGWLEEVVYRRNRRGEVRLWWFSNKPMIIRRRIYVANRLLNNTSTWSPE